MYRASEDKALVLLTAIENAPVGTAILLTRENKAILTGIIKKHRKRILDCQRAGKIGGGRPRKYEGTLRERRNQAKAAMRLRQKLLKIANST